MQDNVRMSAGERHLPMAIRIHPIALRLVFDASFPPPEYLDPSLSHGPLSPWCQAIRAKKALGLVCTYWHMVATPILYEDVVFRRVGQIPAFARTLRSRPYVAQFVKGLTFSCEVPPPLDDVVKASLMCILEQCSRIRSLSCLTPFVGWLQTNSRGLDILAQIPTTFLKDGSYATTNLVYLNDYLFNTLPDILPSPIIIAFSQMTSLSLTSRPMKRLNAPEMRAIPPTLRSLHFPRLKDLTLRTGGNGITGAYLTLITTWDLPQLERLTADFLYRDPSSLFSVQEAAFFQRFGKQLKVLDMDFTPMWAVPPPDPNPGNILNLCPALEHIVLFLPDLFRVQDYMSSVRNNTFVDVWIRSNHFQPDDFDTDPQEYLPCDLDEPRVYGVGKKYLGPNFRFLDMGLQHIRDLPFILPPNSITEGEKTVYLHRIFDLRFAQSRRAIFTVGEDWTSGTGVLFNKFVQGSNASFATNHNNVDDVSSSNENDEVPVNNGSHMSVCSDDAESDANYESAESSDSNTSDSDLGEEEELPGFSGMEGDFRGACQLRDFPGNATTISEEELLDIHANMQV
ncbi:unnamed protein product [Somion occarium]|uniref:F-box domain-containing protein n=1 Tax=Somion occarium TaxID=3059160 RepID=A0ABP1EBK2_9APHY